MPCINFGGGIACFVAGPYEYEGILLEYHSYFGPHPIRRKDYNPWKKVPNKIWLIMNKFAREENKEKFLLKG